MKWNQRFDLLQVGRLRKGFVGSVVGFRCYARTYRSFVHRFEHGGKQFTERVSKRRSTFTPVRQFYSLRYSGFVNLSDLQK